MDLPRIGAVSWLRMLMRAWFCFNAAGTMEFRGLRVFEKGRLAGGASLKILIGEGESGVKQRREGLVGSYWYHLLF